MKILITGANGNVGRHLIRSLHEQNHEVIAITRTPEKTAGVYPDVRWVKADLSQPETLKAHLKGVDAAHLITIEGSDHRPVRQAPKILEILKQAGARKVTVLSDGRMGPLETEIQKSHFDWSVLKPVGFMSNTLGWADSIHQEGVVRDSHGSSATNLIDEADVALAFAKILTTPQRHSGKSYSINGPEVLTTAERVSILSQALGKEIRILPTDEAYDRLQMEKYGIDAETIEYVLAWGRNPPPEAVSVLSTFTEITGLKPNTYQKWVEKNLSKFKRQPAVSPS